VIVFALSLRVCSERPAPPSLTAPSSVTASVAASAGPSQHGGVVAVSGGLTTEVAVLPDGRLAAYLQNAANAPVTDATVQINVRDEDGEEHPVNAVYDPTINAYVGPMAGIDPGPHTMSVAVALRPGTPTINLVTPTLEIPASVAVAVVPGSAPTPELPTGLQANVQASLQPRHGGRLQRINDTYAAEIVAQPRGGVRMYWMRNDGTPVPPAEVNLPSVNLTIAGRVQTVVPTVEADAFILPAEVVVGQSVVVAVPTVTVQGVVVAAPVFEPVVVVAAPVVRTNVVAPVVVAPAVVAPTVVVPGVYVHGHGHGHGRGQVIGVGGGFYFGGGVVVGGPGRGHGHGHH